MLWRGTRRHPVIEVVKRDDLQFAGLMWQCNGRDWVPIAFVKAFRYEFRRVPERAVSSVGRASRLHREGRQFEPVTAHQPALAKRAEAVAPKPVRRRRADAQATARQASFMLQICSTTLASRSKRRLSRRSPKGEVGHCGASPRHRHFENRRACFRSALTGRIPWLTRRPPFRRQSRRQRGCSSVG